MTSISVIHDRREYTTREGDPDDEWDNDCTAASISVKGIKQVSDTGYSDFTVSFDLDDDKSYFLLWADYGTGDSFGSYDNNTEWVDLFRTREAAEKACATLLEQTGYSRSYIRDDGTEITTHVPWEGYFEHLNELHVQKVGTI